MEILNISVILSVYIKEKPEYLKGCLESLLNQSYLPSEIVLVKDGPLTKELELIIDNFKNSFNNFIVLELSKNSGLAYALNHAIKHSKYDFIARMDTDDICKPDRFEKQITFLINNPEVDILGGCIEEINEENKIIKVLRFPLDHQSMRSFIGTRNPLAHPSVMFRKKYFEKAGLYPLNTYRGIGGDEDTIMWLNGFLNNCVFANIPDIIMSMRVNRNFYERRRGFKKSYYDFINRIKVIYKLRLSHTNYLLAFSRFILFSLPFTFILKFAYKYRS